MAIRDWNNLVKGMICMLALLICGCQQVSKSIRDTFNTKPEEAEILAASGERITGFVRDTAALDLAEKLLRQLPQYRAKPIFLYADIHFYDDGRIMTKLQHPDNPDYVDAYNYRNGEWSGPVAVQLSVHENISSRLVALDRVPLRTAAIVVDNYNDKASLVEGAGSADHVYLIIHSGITRWYPNRIDGSREAWDVYFNLDGSVASFLRQ
ncbi:hypothetical protein [Parapedobacter pyrenivorans]|uniref:hypothetical protein n=1 Tax=Parapedobacter pyrenivorans TaxID=1305674 RepID=UPI0033411682